MQECDSPDFSKKGQNDSTQVRVSQAVTFNKTFHVDTIRTINEPEKVIITIMDDSRSFSASTVVTNDSTTSMIIALCDYWFKPYGYPEQGKVQTTKLERMINNLVPLTHMVTCRSRRDTFNTEVEQQWQQNQKEISEEEFVYTINFLHRLREPKTREPLSCTNGGYSETTKHDSKTDDDSENEDDSESRFRPLSPLCHEWPIQQARRKSLSLCRHKLQRVAIQKMETAIQATRTKPASGIRIGTAT
jgi:hypothetical protein